MLELEVLFPDIHITRFDIATFLASIIFASPQGVSNTTDTCITTEVKSKAICKTPDEYIFWDGIHPTQAAHGLVAEAVEVVINPPN